MTTDTTNDAASAAKDAASDAAEKAGKTVEGLLDRIAENQNRLIEAVETARDRTRRVTDEYAKSVAEAQREAIALTRELASHPTAAGKNMEAILESTTAAQARAMEMTKMLYREQVEATEEFQKMMQPLFESTKGLGDLTKRFQSILPK